MSNCVSLINKICDPKYLLHSKETSFAFIITSFPCWVRETAPYLKRNPALISKGKQKFSCVFFWGFSEMLNACLNYGKMEGRIYWPPNMNRLNVVWRQFCFFYLLMDLGKRGTDVDKNGCKSKCFHFGCAPTQPAKNRLNASIIFLYEAAGPFQGS